MSGPDPSETSPGWCVATSLSDIPENGLHDVMVGETLVLLVRRDDQVMAFQGLCPHQFARLADGLLLEDVLQCPRHLARFRLSDGVCASGWQLPPLQRYPVRIKDGAILLPDPLMPID